MLRLEHCTLRRPSVRGREREREREIERERRGRKRERCKNRESWFSERRLPFPNNPPRRGWWSVINFKIKRQKHVFRHEVQLGTWILGPFCVQGCGAWPRPGYTYPWCTLAHLGNNQDQGIPQFLEDQVLGMRGRVTPVYQGRGACPKAFADRPDPRRAEIVNFRCGRT